MDTIKTDALTREDKSPPQDKSPPSKQTCIEANARTMLNYYNRTKITEQNNRNKFFEISQKVKLFDDNMIFYFANKYTAHYKT